MNQMSITVSTTLSDIGFNRWTKSSFLTEIEMRI